MGRPIGASVMLGEWSEADGPNLYMIDPSGTSWGYFGCAVGKVGAALFGSSETRTNLT